MAGLGDLFGRHGVIEQLLLWGALNQVIGALGQPGFTTLTQDVQARHPVVALDPATLADLEARGLIARGYAQGEAAKSGIDAARFAQLGALHKVRLSPADLATAVLRSYKPLGEAEAEAAPQGVTPDMLATLRDLAGDALGPQQLAEAVRRRIIPEHGRGPASIAYDQGIAESRLHDKWGPVLLALTEVLISPPDLAEAVVRRFMDRAQAEAEAKAQGVSADRLATLIHLAGDAPGPQQLAEALRRGAIPREGTGAGSVSFAQGIAEGRLADKWAPVIEDLARLWPSPADALAALVKGQIPRDEGLALYERLGGDPQFYAWLLDSEGEGPSPLEAAEAAFRGLIPWQGTGPQATSYEQAVKESRYRDKWTDFYRRLAEYVPTPGEAITFAAHRAITTEQAAAILRARGVSPQYIPAFLNEIALTDLSEFRGLSISSVSDMYYAHLIDRGQALQVLDTLHVSPIAADLLLQYADLRQVIDSLQRSVQRIAQLYTGRKIGRDTAQAALARLKIPSGSVADILADWDLQAAASVKVLTESQIVDAVYYAVFTPEEGMAELQAIGYTPYDSWALLSLKAKAPLPGKPPRVVAAPPGAVIPGVT